MPRYLMLSRGAPNTFKLLSFKLLTIINSFQAQKKTHLGVMVRFQYTHSTYFQIFHLKQPILGSNCQADFSTTERYLSLSFCTIIGIYVIIKSYNIQ